LRGFSRKVSSTAVLCRAVEKDFEKGIDFFMLWYILDSTVSDRREPQLGEAK
jgi:hypothetical protein